MNRVNWQNIWNGFKRYYKWVLYPLGIFIGIVVVWSYILEPTFTWLGWIDSGKQTYYVDPPQSPTPDKIWITGDLCEYFKPEYREEFLTLPAGETTVLIPKKLGIKLGGSENGAQVFYKTRSGTWAPYIEGALLDLGQTSKIVLKAETETQMYRQYYYRKHNESYVKKKYGV
jgi:hypothetical protein